MSSSRRLTWKSLPSEARDEIRRDRERYLTCVEYLRTHAAGEVEGFYGPESMTWQIYREPAILIGGFRAILLQIADPAVGAGVAENSNFRGDFLGRTRRTFSSMYQLIFGGLPEALGASKRLHNVHALVRGALAARAAAGNEAAAAAYRANDPALLLWVLATLIDTAILVFETFIRPLSLDEKRRYYQETHLAGAQFGIPPGTMPATLEAFQEWFYGRLASTELQAGPTALELAGILFNSPYTRGRFDETLTAGLLPDRWRDAFHLAWGTREQRNYRWLVAAMRRTFALTPSRLRYVTAWHQAQLRLALHSGEKPSRYALLLNQLDSMIDIPGSIRPVAVSGLEELDED